MTGGACPVDVGQSAPLMTGTRKRVEIGRRHVVRLMIFIRLTPPANCIHVQRALSTAASGRPRRSEYPDSRGLRAFARRGARRVRCFVSRILQRKRRVNTSLSSNPGFNRIRWSGVRTSRPPTSSVTPSAICATTRTRRGQRSMRPRPHRHRRDHRGAQVHAACLKRREEANGTLVPNDASAVMRERGVESNACPPNRRRARRICRLDSRVRPTMPPHKAATFSASN